MLCYVVLCCAVLCYVVLCCAMLCYVVLCCVVFSFLYMMVLVFLQPKFCISVAKDSHNGRFLFFYNGHVRRTEQNRKVKTKKLKIKRNRNLAQWWLRNKSMTSWLYTEGKVIDNFDFIFLFRWVVFKMLFFGCQSLY